MVGPGNATDLVVQDGIAYCTYNGAGLRIVNLRDATAPELLWAEPGGSPALGVAVRGTSLACIYGNRRYRTCSVANPRAPVFLTDSDAGAVPTLVAITRRGFAWCGYGRRATLLDIPPYVVAASPSAGRAGLCGDGSVSVYFSSNLDASTVGASSVRVLSGAAPVAGSLNVAGPVVTFRPAEALALGTYGLSVSGAVRSARGTRLAPPSGWSSTFRVTPVCTRFTETPASVTAGASGEFAWLVRGGTRVSATGLRVGASPDPATDALEVTDNLSGVPGPFSQRWTAPPVARATTLYFVADANVDGATYYGDVAAVTVNPAPAPSAEWSVRPAAGLSGAARPVAWSVSNVTDVVRTFVRWGTDPRPAFAASSAQTEARSSAGPSSFMDSITLPTVAAPTTYYAAVVAVVNGGARTVVSPTVSFLVAPPCASGRGDCDGDASNGCEVDLAASATHCGRCGNACPSGQTCTAGACVAPPTAPRVIAAGQGGPIGITTDGVNLYWVNNGSGQVVRAALDGTGVTVIASGYTYISEIVNDDVNLYWTDLSPGRVWAMAKAGGTPRLVATIPNASGLSVWAGTLYVVDFWGGAVYRVPVEGGAPTRIASGLPGRLGGGATDGTWIYLVSADTSSIYRMPIGGGALATLATGQAYPVQTVLDQQHLYWANGGGGGSVARLPRAGGAAQQIAGPLGGITDGVTVDDRYVYWTNYTTGTVSRMPKPTAVCRLARGDCDGNEANGCEADLTASAAHCGACGNACAAGSTCAAGACVAPPAGSAALLLHMDGASGSTTFVDEAGHAMRASGNARISTADSRFGGASGAFDGDGDQVVSPSGPEFNFAGAAPFTIEAWVNGTGVIFSNDSYGLVMKVTPARSLQLWVNDVLPWDFVGTAAGTVPAGWHHVALSYDGTVYRVFVDGARTFQAAGRMTTQTNSYLVVGGYASGTQPWFSGHLDEVRVTRNAALYTESFAAPTAPFCGPSGCGSLVDGSGWTPPPPPLPTGTPAIVASGLGCLQGMILDRSGRMYASVTGAGTILRVDPTVTPATVSTWASGFTGPSQMILDGTGGLVVAEREANRVTRVAINADGTAGPRSTLASGFTGPWGVLREPSGALLVSNEFGSTVDRVAAGGAVTRAVLSGLNGPLDLRYDAEGNLYVGEFGLQAGTTVRVYDRELRPTRTLTGFTGPIGIALDAARNAYVASYRGGDVQRVAPDGTRATFATGLGGPHSIAFDARGNLYVNSCDTGRIYRVGAL